MKITINSYINSNFKYILESEEYRLKTNRIDGFEGTSISEDNEIMFGDNDGNEVLLEDIVRVFDFNDLVSLYPRMDKAILQKLFDKFYSIYKFIDINTYRESQLKQEEERANSHELWESLAANWDFD